MTSAKTSVPAMSGTNSSVSSTVYFFRMLPTSVSWRWFTAADILGMAVAKPLRSGISMISSSRMGKL